MNDINTHFTREDRPNESMTVRTCQAHHEELVRDAASAGWLVEREEEVPSDGCIYCSDAERASAIIRGSGA